MQSEPSPPPIFNQGSSNETSQTLAPALLTKCHTLLSEIDTFQSLLSSALRNPQVVESRSLRTNVVSELRAIEKLAQQINDSATESETATEDGENRLLHALRSSNLPFYETVWTVAKESCVGIGAFGKRFYWDSEGHPGKGKKRGGMDKRKSVFVDIVADDGEEWVKVSTISESRLLFEMAKKGWEADSEDEEEGGEERTVLQNFGSDGGDSDDEDEIELIKLARDMRRAANDTRVRYRHPRLRIVLPKIEEGKHSDIDGLLKEMRSYEITVQCGGSVPGSYIVDAASDLGLSRLLPNPFKRFTATLNVDCTLLLAVVSDLSHFKSILPSSGLHRAINRQIEIDKQQPLLPTEIWPAMDAHELVCTEEAATRMKEIVNTIGTGTEKERMQIMMGDPPFEDMGTASLVQKFQELSDHQVPAQWKIPVQVVEAQSVISSARKHGKLPPVADNVALILSDINHSVFFYGWSTGLMTISSNRTAVRQIEDMIEKHRNGDDDLDGPQVWVCDTARSLIGKERDRKD